MVLHWNIPQIDIITADNDEEEVKKIFCKMCKEFYVDSEEGKVTLEKFTGNVKKVIQNWVIGSEIVKKIMLPTMSAKQITMALL